MSDGLFHEDCGALLERRTLETEEGVEASAGYCSRCDAYADIELDDDWVLTEDQEATTSRERLDTDMDDMPTTQYRFDGCDHEEAFTYELSAGRGDEDNLIVYRCIDCGNTERDTQTTWG